MRERQTARQPKTFKSIPSRRKARRAATGVMMENAAPKMLPPPPIVGKNTADVAPRDRRVPVAEIEGLLLKTVVLIADAKTRGIPAIELTRRGAAVPGTMNRWAANKVRSPLISTLRMTLKACGYELAILDEAGHKL